MGDVPLPQVNMGERSDAGIVDCLSRFCTITKVAVTTFAVKPIFNIGKQNSSIDFMTEYKVSGDSALKAFSGNRPIKNEEKLWQV